MVAVLSIRDRDDHLPGGRIYVKEMTDAEKMKESTWSGKNDLFVMGLFGMQDLIQCNPYQAGMLNEHEMK